jgi:Gram-negative bacterial TonB protein C-terminal
MNPSKSLFVIGTFIVSSFSTALVSRANDHFRPPLPPKAIEPVRLPPDVERGLVRLRMVIDKSGHPRKIALLSVCDQLIETRVVAAVSKWQFTPAMENGRQVEAEVILQIHLVDLSGSGRIRL